jgi:hypothetical protein
LVRIQLPNFSVSGPSVFQMDLRIPPSPAILFLRFCSPSLGTRPNKDFAFTASGLASRPSQAPKRLPIAVTWSPERTSMRSLPVTTPASVEIVMPSRAARSISVAMASFSSRDAALVVPYFAFSCSFQTLTFSSSSVLGMSGR